MAAPQLRLEVSLNLAGFRNEVRKLTQIAQSEFNPLLKVNVDTRDYRAQLKALERIKPVIKIEDSQIDAARARIGTLNKSLATLRRATSTPIEIKLKYVEVGKSSSAAAGQIGRAVSGRVRADQSVAGLDQKQLIAARNMLKAADVPVSGLGKSRSLEAYRKSIIDGMTNAGKESIAGLAQGLKDGQSAIGQAAKTVGDEGVRAIKDTLGIASPSRVFKQIGEFSVDGLELGFLNGLKDFKSKSVAEIRKIVALMRFELAKVSGASMTPGISRSAGPRGSRQYMSPIGPLPEGSKEPWAFSQYRYQPFMAQPGQTRGANVPPMRQRFPFAGAPPVMPTVPPRMMGRSVPALPPAGGTAATREMMLAMRELEARVRSAARAASIFAEDAATAVNRKLLPAVAAGRDALQKASGQVPLGGLPAGIRGFLPPARGGGGGGGGNPPVPPPGGGGGGFPSDGMRGPSTQLGAGYYEVGKGLKGIQSAYGQAKGFLNTNKFPAAGAIAGLGSEFGNAIKQVLLFGTAYKALAFLTSLPGEAFEAAKGLATYKNQLQAVTAESGTFEQSFAFVDGLAARFNVPLDSARQGFIKLYASMEPAGFDQGQIEGLFTGISKASAAFGLSADKVDRVNYAFAQMASKGQIMSEELKGQLGDVLPGALGLFAEAAQMSIPEFSKAMEDGAFKGEAMEQVLGNVSILLNTKFGPAAEGAAKTLQGAVNQIQNNLSLMYQAFAPIVDGVAAAFGPQVNSLIKDVTDTVKVLTTTLVGGSDGFDTLSPRAQAFYAAVQTLEPALRQAGAALTDLGSRLAALAPYFVQVLASVISFASSPLARAALIAALAIGTLTAAMKLLEVTGIKAVLKSIYTFIGTLTTGIPVACAIARVAVIGLKLVITGLFAGAVLIGLDFLVGKLLRIGDAANDSAKDILGMRKELDAMAGAGDIESTSKAYLDANTKLAAARKANQKALNDLRAAKDRPEGNTQADINKGVAVANAQTKVDQTYTKVIEAQKEVQAARRSRASAVSVQEGQKEQTQAALQEVDLSAGDGDGTKPPKGGKERESQIPQLTLALEKTKELSGIEMRIVNAQLMSNTAQLSSLELLKQLVEFKYEAKALGLEDLTTEERALKYKEIGLRREQAIFENQLQLQITLRKERDEIQKGFSATLAGYQQEANYQQMYLDLINQGVLPSLAKVRVEAEKAFAEGEKQLNQSIEQQEANIAGLAVTIEALKLEKNLTLEKQEQLEAAENTLKTLKEDLRLRGLLKGTAPERKDAAIDAAERGLAPKTVQEYISEGTEAAEDRLRELMNTGYQVVQAANAIGDAFGTAFKGLVSGSMTAQEALAGMFQSIADHFADMVAQMIAEYLKMALIKGIAALIGGIFGGGGGGSDNSAAKMGLNTPDMQQYAPLPREYANGGIAYGGFTAFANGGMVTGPTMGLVGEGRYNEAIVPLPDGKSIPVQLAGGDGGNQIVSNITVNVSNGQAQSNATGSNSSEMGRKIEGAVKQVIVGELRPGGLLASKK
jgi:tape measure domain-containing protein